MLEKMIALGDERPFFAPAVLAGQGRGDSLRGSALPLPRLCRIQNLKKPFSLSVYIGPSPAVSFSSSSDDCARSSPFAAALRNHAAAWASSFSTPSPYL